jgi:hypothetical protein
MTTLGPCLGPSWAKHGAIAMECGSTAAQHPPGWTHSYPRMTTLRPCLGHPWSKHCVIAMESGSTAALDPPGWTHTYPRMTCFGPLLDPFWTPFGRSWRVLGAIKAIGTPRRACWELKGLSGCITALPQVTSLRLEYYLQYRTQRV